MEKIINYFNNITYKKDYPLFDLTWFKVGGNAEIAVFPKNIKEVIQILNICKKKNIPLFILGGGANVIISDSGLPGVTLITSKLNKISLQNGKIYAECGVNLENLAEFAYVKNISGFEFLYNIPGSVGGSLMMNAGNNYGEMKEITFSVNAFGNNKIQKFKNKYCNFGYRTSFFKVNKMFIFSAEFKGNLRKDNFEIRSLMDKIKNERSRKFPLEYPNGGSVFKRPKGDYAGRLIEISGCGGMKIGGAEVSTKHKGFIVNKNNATATDIKNLIKKVQKTVFNNTGRLLEREQIFLPEDFYKIT